VTKISIGLSEGTSPAPPTTDGRRLRGQDNRARIVEAMLEIIGSGEPVPGAEQVAARANVGLRTVFRHFKDMDSLYSEMSDVIEGEVYSVVDQPFQASDWRGRVIELVARRGTVFENIGPFKRASDIFRHRSRFLDADNTRLVTALRDILKRELPAEVVADPIRLEVLDLLLSFESWSRLRREQGLTAPRAVEILEAAVRKIIAA
jgi:AcrR family transcriptional regulator